MHHVACLIIYLLDVGHKHPPVPDQVMLYSGSVNCWNGSVAEVPQCEGMACPETGPQNMQSILIGPFM